MSSRTASSRGSAPSGSPLERPGEERLEHFKREAQAWLAWERAAIAGGVDPRAGRATVRSLLPVWLEERRHSISAKTYVFDAALARLLPHSLAALSVNAVTDREVSRALIALTQDGLAESSVRRFRASLSSFFAWAVREAADPGQPGAAHAGP